MAWSLGAVPDEVAVAILRAHDDRRGTRVWSSRWRGLATANFAVRHFAAPAGDGFCVDFEVDRSMSKDTWTARFQSHGAGHGKRYEGSVAFLSLTPVYYRLDELDTCALWRLATQIREDTLKVIKFQPGRLGMQILCAAGSVEAVGEGSQAEQAGVKKGWTILSIAGEAYSRAKLDAKILGSSSYEVTFRLAAPEESFGHLRASPPAHRLLRMRHLLHTWLHDLSGDSETHTWLHELFGDSETDQPEEHDTPQAMRDLEADNFEDRQIAALTVSGLVPAGMPESFPQDEELGHLTVTEGDDVIGRTSQRHVIGRISAEDTRRVLSILDYRRNKAAELLADGMVKLEM